MTCFVSECPDYTICKPVGDDPNYGYTNFNTFYYAFLSVIRLSMQDNWEELYLQVLETNGEKKSFYLQTLLNLRFN